MRPPVATIDLEALRHNIRLARDLAPDSRLLAVVKADAYGHGAVPVARALAPYADALAVAGLDEARALRAAGLEHPIVLLAGCFSADELSELGTGGFEPVIHTNEQVEWLLSTEFSRPIRVWLKFDSGMHRLGLDANQFRRAHERLRSAPQVGALVLMSHLACADAADDRNTLEQLERFAEVTADLEGERSIANSAAVLALPDSHADWIRPGIMLYGWSPLDHQTRESDDLLPVMRLTSRIIAIRDLAAGEAVGYGRRFVCRRPTRIGVVAMGYGDGYPRAAPDGTPVLVNGRRCAIAGRVSMDLLTVDITEAESVDIGDEVELWGPGLSANEVASHCGTIAYELVTRVAPRVPRTVVQFDSEEDPT